MESTNWKITLAYDGTEFHGWQVQRVPSAMPSGRSIPIETIQGALADAIMTVVGERVLPQGAGRTDAGVHAAGQVASFSLATPIPAANLQHALNRVLPAAIRIVNAEHAPPEFHARYSSVGKIYQYRIFDGPVCSPFLARYVTHSRWTLDLGAMQQAALAILGEHDFTSFAAVDPDRTARQRQKATREIHAPEEKSLAPDSVSRYSNIRRIDQLSWSCFPISQSPPDLLAGFPSLSPPRHGGTGEERPAAGKTFEGDEAARILTCTVRGSGFLHHMVRNLVGTFIEIGRGRIEPSAMLEILEGRNRALAGPTAAPSGLCLVSVLY